jgi:clan AA aspartic protease
MRDGKPCQISSSISYGSGQMPRIGWVAMAQEDGSGNARLEAWLRVLAAGGEEVDCLVDTGFNGALVLPRSEAARLKLTVLGRVLIIGVGRVRQVADVAELEIEWLGQSRAVEVIISDGDDSLLGTKLLDNSRLVIDYSAYTVTVSD